MDNEVYTPLHPRAHAHVACKSIWNYSTLIVTHYCRCGHSMGSQWISPENDPLA